MYELTSLRPSVDLFTGMSTPYERSTYGLSSNEKWLIDYARISDTSEFLIEPLLGPLLPPIDDCR